MCCHLHDFNKKHEFLGGFPADGSTLFKYKFIIFCNINKLVLPN